MRITSRIMKAGRRTTRSSLTRCNTCATKPMQKGKPRIQIHAWINACAIGGNASAGALTKLHPEWLSLSDTGADFDTEATKIDPGNPDAAEWTFRVYMDVVRHYDVDGIHLDFIRYGGDGKTVGHWGYNAVSVARYNARYGTTAGSPLWNDPRWQAWRREQVTALVRRVYVNATGAEAEDGSQRGDDLLGQCARRAMPRMRRAVRRTRRSSRPGGTGCARGFWT